MEHEHDHADIPQAGGKIADGRKSEGDSPAIVSITRRVRHVDQAAEQSNPDADGQAINGQLAKKWQMRGGILHDAGTHEPGSEQEHADQDYGEAEITRGFFREPAATPLHRLPVTTAREDAEFLFFVLFPFGEGFLPLSLAFSGALFLALFGAFLSLLRLSCPPRAQPSHSAFASTGASAFASALATAAAGSAAAGTPVGAAGVGSFAGLFPAMTTPASGSGAKR